MVAIQAKKDDSEVNSVSIPQKHGELIIIGGAEDKENECTILREFIRRSGGRRAKIAIMTAATSLPGEVGAMYRNIFERFEVEQVDIIDTERREDASDSRNLEIIEQATGVFFSGGDQSRITDLLKDTEIDRILHERLKSGLIIAGTSAGAAMMSEIMIVEGEAETHPRLETVTLEPGMGFIHQVAIDQHFAQRGRLGRLVSALVQQPAVLGIGIDENTAIIVNGDRLEVIGEGGVTIIDLANISHTNVDETLHDEALAICGAKLHILPDGYYFDLQQRVSMPARHD
ncbi:MAG: cyanophycinase [Pleurocapsa minor HA4230-MV1]|jgi:cyanophycinase|nr:cyanophycinase [Pleurocapsa minor HA4230-MV1]